MEQQTMTVTVEEIAKQIKAGKYDEARESLGLVEESNENRPELLFLRGLLLESTFGREAALDAYQQVLELAPNHADARFRAALLCDLLGDDEAAIAHYEKCKQQSPARVNALINLAVLYEERGRLSDAEYCLKSVLAEHPNHQRARHFLKSVISSYTMRYDDVGQGEREHRSAILDTPISDFELSVRSRNCLRQMDIKSLGDLLRTTEAELLSYKNFGETSLNEIKAMLRQKGLSLGQGVSAVESPFFAKSTAAMHQSAHAGRPVSELELSVRSRRCLQQLGVNTLGELAMCSEEELMATKNFGQTSLAEIKRQLAIYGLSFRS